MLEGTVIASMIAAVVTSLDNCSNPNRMPRHRDDPRPNKKPRFILGPGLEMASGEPRSNHSKMWWRIRRHIRTSLLLGASL